jgi:uncharacterized protein (TIGR02266 family)
MSSSPKEGANRRRHERVSLKIPVDYTSVDAFFTEFSSNINEGGMFVEMENAPELGRQVQLQFDLPGYEESVQVEGRVAWMSDGKDGSPPGVGIEFQNLPGDVRDTINRVVRKLRKQG